jgi:integrase
MKAPTFPMEVKKGSCAVTIYETPTKGYMAYTLAYYQEGKRKRETCAEYLAMRTRADEVLEDLSEGRTDSTALKASERNDFARALQILKPTGIPIDVAARHYARAFEILGSDMVIAAAQEYAKRHLNRVVQKTVAEVVTDLLDEKKGKSKRHYDTLRLHLDRFKKSVLMNMASVTASDIDAFLDGMKVDKLPVSARTRDNYANSIGTLCEFAKRKRYVASDFDEHTRITRMDNGEDGTIEIYTPKEMQELLKFADAKLIPFLAIGAFAGLRSSEIMRLDWKDVRFDTASIIVQKGKVKKRGMSRRIVPMSKNLIAWLKPHAESKGSIWPGCVTYIYDCLRELAPKAGTTWKSNALRHSFISYRVALVKNVPQVALESGNSVQMIHANYLELVQDADAANWFGIMPEAKA